LDEWSKYANELSDAGVALQYQLEAGAAATILEFLNPELKLLPPRHRKFRAEPFHAGRGASVNLWVRTLDGVKSRRKTNDETETCEAPTGTNPSEPSGHHLRRGHNAGPA
jgi:hypothetical protein